MGGEDGEGGKGEEEEEERRGGGKERRRKGEEEEWGKGGGTKGREKGERREREGREKGERRESEEDNEQQHETLPYVVKCSYLSRRQTPKEELVLRSDIDFCKQTRYKLVSFPCTRPWERG